MSRFPYRGPPQGRPHVLDSNPTPEEFLWCFCSDPHFATLPLPYAPDDPYKILLPGSANSGFARKRDAVANQWLQLTQQYRARHKELLTDMWFLLHQSEWDSLQEVCMGCGSTLPPHRAPQCDLQAVYGGLMELYIVKTLTTDLDRVVGVRTHCVHAQGATHVPGGADLWGCPTQGVCGTGHRGLVCVRDLRKGILALHRGFCTPWALWLG